MQEPAYVPDKFRYRSETSTRPTLMTSPFPRLVPLGDAALLAEFSETLDLAVNTRIQQLAAAIRERHVPWIRDVVPALGSLALHFDPAQYEPGLAPRDAAAALIRDCLRRKLPALDELARRVEVPVCYAPELAPDLAEVASRCRLAVEDVIARHCASPHRVLMVGFVPGHPYIGGLDPALAVPRRTTPRPKVMAGSVAIANAQTVVYPFTISGGWNIIGRTPLRVFDAAREPPALFFARRSGAVRCHQPRAVRSARAGSRRRSSAMSVRVVRAGLLTSVQDLGRYGLQHLGIVPGGAMDAVAHRIANALVGNPAAGRYARVHAGRTEPGL